MVASVDTETYAAAVILAVLAGFVDAMGFVTLGGFFVSFMSGNTTRTGVSVIDGDWHSVAIGAGIIGLFVLGVILGSFVGERGGRRPGDVVVALVAALLIVALAGSALGTVQVVIGALALAMGAENTVFGKDSGSSISLTYMTGTLVKMGRAVVEAVHGGPHREWMRYFGLWCALLVGVTAGTALHRAVGLAGLWAAVVLAVALAVWFRIREGDDTGSVTEVHT